MYHLPPRFALRLAYRAGALLLGDLVTGMAAFSCISSGTLWMFSLGWIRLHAEYAAVGQPFGTGLQLDLAWFGALAGLPLLAIVLFLSVTALRLPLGIFRRARAV